MLYARCVGLVKDKSPSSQATRSHPGNARSYESKVLNETMLPMMRKKSHYFTHPAQDTTNSNPHFNQRERTEREKKRRPAMGDTTIMLDYIYKFLLSLFNTNIIINLHTYFSFS